MKTSHLVIGGIILALIAFVIGRASKNVVTVTKTTNGANGNNGAGGRFATSPVDLGRWKQVPNLSTGACPQGSSSGRDLGEDPIGTTNGNPVYRCYISTANAS